MSSGFQNPITIKDAMNNIHSRRYLLPGIQREFTWSSEQIEMLFDSILRDYPINSFMFWQVRDERIKSTYKFYEFIKEFRERFATTNQAIDTKNVPDFEAVIDGQQRLTSLYIGLHGTYAYKTARKRWVDNEECIPTRMLYLNLKEAIDIDYDSQKEFDFRFLSEPELEEQKTCPDAYFWFKVGDILDLDSVQKVNQFLMRNNLADNAYAVDTLMKLFSVIHIEKLINYYLQVGDDSNKVLEIFIRTNSGGTPLSFSDLLLSIASANWKDMDARDEIQKLTKEIYNDRSCGFNISKDFVLKTCLVLFSDDIRFKLENFTHESIKIFEDNWQEIRASIISAFKLFRQLGFNDTNFRAKNAAIPVIYYIYFHKLTGKIENPAYKDEENKKNIAKWLILSFIKSIFGGQADSILKKMKNVLEAQTEENFPDKALMEAFKAHPSKNYSFDDDFIEGLLESKKDTSDAFYVLHLIYSHLDYLNQDVHQDHLHPAKFFTNQKHFKANIPEEIREFAKKEENWNGVANLQLLNGRLNESKNDAPLKEWVVKYNKTNKDLFLSDGISLELQDFKDFIIDRKENLKTLLKQIVTT